MFPLLCPSLPLVEEQALNSAQVQEGFAPATHPFSQCCQGFWTEISAQLVGDNHLSEPKGLLCKMKEVLLCEDAGFPSKHCSMLEHYRGERSSSTCKPCIDPGWDRSMIHDGKFWMVPGITHSSIGSIKKSDVDYWQPF